MPKPPISITCDCGEAVSLPYGEGWTCPSCGRKWDTKQIPRAEYDRVVRGVRLYGLLAIGPPLLAAAVLIPLTLVLGTQFAILFFLFVLAWSLLVVPQLRRRATRIMRDRTPEWKLRPE